MAEQLRSYVIPSHPSRLHESQVIVNFGNDQLKEEGGGDGGCGGGRHWHCFKKKLREKREKRKIKNLRRQQTMNLITSIN